MKLKYRHDENILFLLSSAHWKLHRILTQNLKESSFDITPDQWLILLNLLNDGPLHQSALSRTQGKDRAAIKRLIDHLERKGFVRRERTNQDLRHQKVSITESGMELLEKVSDLFRKVFRERSRSFTEVEFNALKRLIRKINEE